MSSKLTNKAWQEVLSNLIVNYENEVKPRGMAVREVISGHYRVPIPAYLSLAARKVSVPFMFAEPWWILSGSNRLSDIEPYMKGFREFSDEGKFMAGAYGPKVIDQLPYVVGSLVKDQDTRQAVLNIWRERPGPSKDTPCTTGMQFFIRDGNLTLVVTMRSQDAVLGFTYDVFTFSMIARAVQLLLVEQGVIVGLGDLCVNVGSLHLYERHYETASDWVLDTVIDGNVNNYVTELMDGLDAATTYEELLDQLKYLADRWKRNRS